MVMCDSCQGSSLRLFWEPKFTVMCGKCHKVFKQRIMVLGHDIYTTCPYCNETNELPLTTNG
jgi:hypothetical protein